jgi:hypothetical protein
MEFGFQLISAQDIRPERLRLSKKRPAHSGSREITKAQPLFPFPVRLHKGKRGFFYVSVGSNCKRLLHFE